MSDFILRYNKGITPIDSINHVILFINQQQIQQCKKFIIYRNRMSVLPIDDHSSKRKATKVQFMLKTNKTHYNLMDNPIESQKLLGDNQEKYIMLKKVLENIIFQIFITIITIFSLFLQDIRTIFIETQYDQIVDIIHLIFMGIFITEIVLSLFIIDGYFCSFFFFLDVLSTISIIMDVSFIIGYIYSANTTGTNNFQISQFIAQSKASRAAARAVRIMKIFRLTRVVKLYKSAVRSQQIKQIQHKRVKIKELIKRKNQLKRTQFISEHKSTQLIINLLSQKTNFILPDEVINPIIEFQDQQTKLQNLDKQKITQVLPIPIEQIPKKQSKISKVLSQTTIKKIIIVILAIMFSIPLLQSDTYFNQNTSLDFVLDYVHRLLLNPNIPLSFILQEQDLAIKKAQELSENLQIITFHTPFNQLRQYYFASISNQRFDDIGIFEQTLNISQILKIRSSQLTLKSGQEGSGSLTIIVSYYIFSRYDSLFSVGKILFLCITLIYLLSSFNSNLNELIVEPIEQMMQAIKNPKQLQKLQHEDNYQTTIVHNSIVKIRSLIKMIFGEYGTEQIYSKVTVDDHLKDQSSYFIHSKKTIGIYGIYRISFFEQILKALNSDIVTLVNEIAYIVHTAVFRYGGSAVKNYQDGFLVVWKLPEDEIKKISNSNFEEKQNYVNILTDYALYSVVKLIVKINKEPKFLQYKKDQRLIQKLNNNSSIKMSCLLTFGQSYEALIGSYFKIDPIYLGNKLNQLQKLSKITKNNYSSSIILDNDFVSHLTPSLKQLCRIIDCIKIDKYTIKQIYTIDMDLQNISPPRNKNEKYKNIEDKPDIQLKRQINMDTLRDQIEIDNYNSLAFINCKKQLRQVLKNATTEDTRQRYNIGFNFYISGQWKQAQIHLTQLLRLHKDDQLAKRLYQFMQGYDFISPQGWSKYRDYTSNY